MKKILLLLILSFAYSVGEASAVFLLINPGAGPAGTGEAFVAKADDAYASFYNPAGLGFQSGTSLTGMHVSWLPNLADDLYYDFLAFKRNIGAGTIGGHIVFLNLGEQQATGDNQEDLGTFRSNMWALTGSYGTQTSKNGSIGVSFKILQQNLAPFGAGTEESDGISTNFAFDIGLLKKWQRSNSSNYLPSINLGLSISNIGPKVWFKDQAQADPLPTNMKLGIFANLFSTKNNEINFLFDMNKLLVTRYQAMDWDGDGIVGSYDGDGLWSENNMDGQNEWSHDDPWYKAIVTSWLDDWALGGDIDYDLNTYIGGYSCNDDNGDGEYTEDLGEIVKTEEYQFGDEGYGAYNEDCVIEVGSDDDRTIAKEFKEMIYNIGLEYWYAKSFVLRLGYIYDQEGKIMNPTIGAGVRLSRYGFDFGYTAGDQGHPRANTMFFSINLDI